MCPTIRGAMAGTYFGRAASVLNRCFRGSWNTFFTRSISDVPMKRTVLVSTSNNIYENLALEDWFYKHHTFSNAQVLLLWRNEPCVVIGRHQNPWLECSVNYLKNSNIKLARRNSGGGTVYHDMGNLNCTFYTDRKSYTRKPNLQLICDAIKTTWDLRVSISHREDVMLENDFKISGTAAKLGREAAYHHCTLLFNSDKEKLHSSLLTRIDGVESKATASIRSLVKNLKDYDQTIDYWPLITSISQQYLKNICTNERVGWNMVTPSEEQFPGLTKIKSDLQSWEWIYGRTPKFTIVRSFSLPTDIPGGTVSNELSEMAQMDFHRNLSTTTATLNTGYDLKVSLEVYHGKIEKIEMEPNDFVSSSASQLLVSHLVGKYFRDDDVKTALLEGLEGNDSKENDFLKLKYVGHCVQEMVKTL